MSKRSAPSSRTRCARGPTMRSMSAPTAASVQGRPSTSGSPAGPSVALWPSSRGKVRAVATRPSGRLAWTMRSPSSPRGPTRALLEPLPPSTSPDSARSLRCACEGFHCLIDVLENRVSRRSPGRILSPGSRVVAVARARRAGLSEAGWDTVVNVPYAKWRGTCQGTVASPSGDRQ